jgi:hypothetical protein
MTALRRLKGRATALAPAWVGRVRALYHVIRPGRSPHRTIGRKLATTFGWRVLNGPFTGMRYPWWTPSGVSHPSPKLLGCYETELSDVIEQIASKDYQVLVNVGCAEGYYAVGLARRLPDAVVYAFESEPVRRSLCAEIARMNDVAARVRLQGACTPSMLAALPLHGAVIICDVEGAEIDLVRLDLVPGLRYADLVIEVHEDGHGNVKSVLAARLERSHAVRFIPLGDRDPTQIPHLEHLDQTERLVAITEVRHESRGWLVAWAREYGEGSAR